MIPGSVGSSLAGEEIVIPPPAEPAEPTMLYTTYNKTSGGSEDLVIYLPEGYGDDPAEEYHTHFFYHGDGGDGTFSHVTAASMSTGGSNLYTITGANTGSRRILYSTIIIKVAGVEVARCRRLMNGTSGEIYSTGAIDDITGSVAISSASSAISVQFPGAPGGAVTIDYKHSALFEAGLPMYLNRGTYDWEKTIAVMVQKALNNTVYIKADHYTDLRNYMIANYQVDTNRITVSGLSRGGYFCAALAVDNAIRPNIAAFMINSGSTVSVADWNTMSDKGFMYIVGQNEAAEGYPPGANSILNNCGALTMHNYPGSVFVQNTGHTGTVWNTNCYNKDFAQFQFTDFLRVWSLDYNEQAELHVEMAEERLTNINRWREAVRAVYFLPAGALKTELEGRLAVVKTAIDAGKRRWVFDFGTTVDTQTYLSVNHLTANFTAGRVYSSMKDDDGNTTAVGLTVINQFATTPANRFGTSVRGSNAQFGFTRENYFDGISLSTAVTTGQFKITGLNPAKTYRLRFYVANGSTSNAHNMSMSITVGGTTVNGFTTYTNRRVIGFTGKAPDGSGELLVSAYASGDTNCIMNMLSIEEEV
jgi:hypothetical protein